MPTLNWAGKDKVINHHLDVPMRVLERVYTFGPGAGIPGSAGLQPPRGRGCGKLLVNGADAPFAESAVDQSRYVDCSVAADGEVDFEVLF